MNELGCGSDLPDKLGELPPFLPCLNSAILIDVRVTDI
jgi:hypothetical protein